MSTRLNHIDTMRGIAAIGVCYFHAAEHFVNTASITSGIEYNIMHVF